MKKIICGAMVLLAAVTGFTSCNNDKGGKNSSNELTSLSLNKTEVVIAPEETLQLKATTNTGEIKTYVWETSNPDVATVSAKGLVTGMSYGTANITCSIKDNPSIKAVCQVTVESKLKTLKFTRATVSLPIRIDSTKTYDITTKYVDEETKEPIVLKAYMADIAVWLYSEGFYLNNEGKRVSEDKNKAFTIYIPTQVQIIPANLNPDYFEDENDYATWATGAELYKSGAERGLRTAKVGTVTDAYLTHMKAAFNYWNLYANDLDETNLENYWIERYTAVNEGIEGAQLYQWEYNEELGNYDMHANPSALVTNLAVRLDYGSDDLKFMYSIASYDITVKPFGGLFGCQVKQNSVTYEYEFTSDELLYEDNINYIKTQTAE